MPHLIRPALIFLLAVHSTHARAGICDVLGNFFKPLPVDVPLHRELATQYLKEHKPTNFEFSPAQLEGVQPDEKVFFLYDTVTRKTVGSISYALVFDKGFSRNKLVIRYYQVNEDFRDRHIGTLLLAHSISHPDTNFSFVEGFLTLSNGVKLRQELEKGKTYLEAVKETYFYKALASLGFSRILRFGRDRIIQLAPEWSASS